MPSVIKPTWMTGTTARRVARPVAAAVEPVAAAVATVRPSRLAGIKRTLKFTAFAVFGTVLVNAGALAASVAVGFNAPETVISVASLLCGAVAAGVQKSLSWTDAPTPGELPTMQPPSGRG